MLLLMLALLWWCTRWLRYVNHRSDVKNHQHHLRHRRSSSSSREAGCSWRRMLLTLRGSTSMSRMWHGGNCGHVRGNKRCSMLYVIIIVHYVIYDSTYEHTYCVICWLHAGLKAKFHWDKFLVTSSRTWRRRQLPRNKLATSYKEVGDNLFVRCKNSWGIYRVWEFHTYRKFTDELYEVYENIYIFYY